MNTNKLIFTILLVISLFIPACGVVDRPDSTDQSNPVPNNIQELLPRETKIPINAVKKSPETDEHPPVLNSDEYEKPVPVPGEVNTAGGEDSPFITPDGNSLYFFFTPDVNIPAEKQLLDGVTGIYVSRKVNGFWDTPERILLQDPGKLALDGCEFVLGDVMWFCSIREGYSEIHWFTAKFIDGTWQDWKILNFNPDDKVGELHLTNDGRELYFASDRPGGKGQLDIWLSKSSNAEWQEPINMSVINTQDSEGWPAITPDGSELWFYRNYSIWRSEKKDGEWQEAELIVSTLAGEPSIDRDGNLYFVHHYFVGDKMIEADIYVAYRK